MKVYLSGPIGTQFEEARVKFALAAKQVEAFGHEPVNPFDNGLDDGAPWERHIVADIAMLLECEGIYLLRGWGKSRGARIEQYIARERGLAIFDQPEI